MNQKNIGFFLCSGIERCLPLEGKGDRRMAVDEVVAERITIPPTSPSLGHLPLHKGGFGGVEDVAPYGHAPVLYRHGRNTNHPPEMVVEIG